MVEEGTTPYRPRRAVTADVDDFDSDFDDDDLQTDDPEVPIASPRHGAPDQQPDPGPARSPGERPGRAGYRRSGDFLVTALRVHAAAGRPRIRPAGGGVGAPAAVHPVRPGGRPGSDAGPRGDRARRRRSPRPDAAHRGLPAPALRGQHRLRPRPLRAQRAGPCPHRHGRRPAGRLVGVGADSSPGRGTDHPERPAGGTAGLAAGPVQQAGPAGRRGRSGPGRRARGGLLGLGARGQPDHPGDARDQHGAVRYAVGQHRPDRGPAAGNG